MNSPVYASGSLVCIATGYGLEGPGIESRWGRDFPHLSRPALGPTHPPVQWVPSISQGVKSGRGVTLTPHPLLVPWSRKCRAIPLLPLWAIEHVQSLIAFTWLHFTLYIYIYTHTHTYMLSVCWCNFIFLYVLAPSGKEVMIQKTGFMRN